MAKINKRMTIKGVLDIKNNEFIEFDKELGELKHSLSDLCVGFDLVDDVSLTLSYDQIIIPE